MLAWFVDIDTAAQEETDPICVSQVKRLVGVSAMTDENVSIDVIRKYFNSEAWSVVRAVVNAVKHDPLFYCRSCTHAINDDSEQSIACDLCLQWSHFACTSIRATPKARVRTMPRSGAIPTPKSESFVVSFDGVGIEVIGIG